MRKYFHNIHPIHEPPLTIDTTTFDGFLKTLTRDQRQKFYHELDNMQTLLKQKGFHVDVESRRHITVWLRLPNKTNPQFHSMSLPQRGRPTLLGKQHDEEIVPIHRPNP
jgi:hypothetical protein